MNGARARKTEAANRVYAILVPVIISTVLLVAAPGAACAAAGLPCAKATRPIESLTCGDPGLSDLNGQMAEPLPPRPNRRDPAVLREQRRWVAWRLRSRAVPGTRRAALTAWHPGVDTPVRLDAGHPLKQGWTKLPRIAGAKGHMALERINLALAAADAKDTDDDCIMQRDVNTTLVGRRYLNFVVSTVSKCAGAEEIDLGTEILGFDLKTGTRVNWAAMLPPSFRGSDTERQLYRNTLIRSDPVDAKDCAGFSFGALDVWPDAREDGVAFQPAGSFPASNGRCIISVVVPLAAMRKLGANPTLLDDIAHASAASVP